MIYKLAKTVCPHFPEHLGLKETQDRVTWYLISGCPPVLKVPPVSYLKTNMMELDKFIESVNAFAVADMSAKEYDWENLNLQSFTGMECLEGIKKLKKLVAGNRVAVDIETRRIEYEDNSLLSIGFAYDDSSCIALYDIPIKGARHTLEDASEEVFRELQELLLTPSATFIWHNGKFDVNRLKYLCNLDARVDEDTMLKHYACINEKKGTHGLKDLGQLYLQAPAWDDELDKIKREWCRKNKVKLAEFMYDYIPVETLIPYMQRDCIATYRLLSKFEQLAREGSDFVYRMLIRASSAYGAMELRGVKVDLDYLDEYGFELETELREAQRMLDKVAEQVWDPVKYSSDTGAKALSNEKFNNKSPKQLKWMLKEVLGYEVSSTDAATITSLAAECESGAIYNPLAKDFILGISKIRKLNKYMDTYVQGIRDVLCGDFRVRCTYNLHGTETGRLSCSGPNMQNIPRNKKIKCIFVASPGYKLLQLDYSQAELRVLAMLSGDPFMIKAYQEGRDFHDAVAEGMYGPGFDKEQRNMAKTINFGIAYGRGPGSIAETFGKSMVEAKRIIEDWYKPMPKVRDYINSQRKKPILGEPCVSMLGRERHFVITNEGLNHIQNEYINTPIQSLASDFTMLSLIDIHEWIKQNDIDARIVITVHDSIILEVKDDPKLVDKVAEKCTQIMAETPKKYVTDCQVPFKADAEIGYAWGALEEWVMSD